MTQQQQLQEWIDGSNKIVFFGGAGVSTERGYLVLTFEQ